MVLSFYSKEAGEKELDLRNAITPGQTAITESTHSYDPFPTPRDDALSINPFEPTPEISKASKVKNEDYIPSVSSVSPSESCTSPDLVIVDPSGDRVIGKDTQHYISDNDDLGYSSSVSHSYTGSVVSPQSVTSSLSTDDTGSYCNSVFHGSPRSRQSPDLLEETVTHKPNLLATLLVANSKPPNSQTSHPSLPSQASPPSLPSPHPNQYPLHQSNYHYQGVNPGYPQQQHVDVSKQVFSAQPVNNMMPYQQFPMSMNSIDYHQLRGGLQMIRPTVEFSATVLPGQYISNNLPVLTVEDVQLITSNNLSHQCNNNN